MSFVCLFVCLFFNHAQCLPTFFFNKFIYFNWRLITLQYCIGFAILQRESATGIHMFPILNPPPSPYHPSGSSQCTSLKHPVCVSLLIFCLVDLSIGVRGVLLIYSFIFVSICLTYCGAPMLGARSILVRTRRPSCHQQKGN